MKIKNVKTSLLILSGLIILSFGFFVYAQDNSVGTNIFDSTGQDGAATSSNNLSSLLNSSDLSATPSDASNGTTDSNNLTQQAAQQIVGLINGSENSSDSSNSGITMDQIQALVDSSTVNSQTINLPQISKSDIKIKKQDYAGTAAEIQKKKQDDFDNYIVAMSYIIASNSPTPITSNVSLTDLATTIFNKVTLALTTRSETPLEDLSVSAQKSLDQMKDIEVPEDLVDVHIKGMELMEYAIQIKNYLNPTSSDPLADITNLSKLEGLVSAASDFYSQAETKFSQYNMDEGAIQSKLNSLGISIPVVPDSSAADNTNTNSTSSNAQAQ